MTPPNQPLSSTPVCSEVDAADSQVVAAADKTRLQFQSSPVGGYRLLWATSVSECGAQLIPQQVVLAETGTNKMGAQMRTEHGVWPQRWRLNRGFFTNLRCDRQSSAKTVHCLVVLPAKVEENSKATLQLGVHLGGVGVGRMQEQSLDISEQRSVQEKQTEAKG